MTEEFSWYVVRAISGQEKKIAKYIESELEHAKLSKYVQQILIPMEKVYQIKNGKKIAKDRSFFPGYILIHANLMGEVAPTIKSVNGVVGFLGANDLPVPLRQGEVNRILGNVDEISENSEERVEPFIVGEHVKVIDGPFSGFSGVIEEANEEKKKLKVMVKIFGRKTPLELNYGQVEKE
ncbi:MAG: transcription termination/antitermination factor NusG [Bacteroidia bacterium]|nr:transcription termination/antitermination factor NusG [Bacteroidia bacterium]MCO5253202.1 transcription termination/antitermination protein NusG [Bacteroidota bacterium]